MISILAILESFYNGGTVVEASKKFAKTIAILPGAMKPPHAGHFDMIQKYAKKADEVIVLISDPKAEKSQRKTKNGTVITAEMSKEILDIYVKRYGLQNKVKITISPLPAPVAAAYEYIDTELKDCNIILGASLKGDDWKRFNGAKEYFKDRDDINILDPHLTAVHPFMNNGIAISATDIRNNIDDKNFIKKRLPDRLTPKDLNKIIRILTGSPTKYESALRERRMAKF